MEDTHKLLRPLLPVTAQTKDNHDGNLGPRPRRHSVLVVFAEPQIELSETVHNARHPPTPFYSPSVLADSAEDMLDRKLSRSRVCTPSLIMFRWW